MSYLKYEKESLAKLLFFTLSAITPLYLVFCQLGLFADGSYILYLILKLKTIVGFASPRYFTHFLSQFLVLGSIHLGIKNNSILIFVHSFNLIFIPAFVWWISLYKSRNEKYFWFFVAIYSVVYLNSSFCSIGEYNFAYAFVALCLSILLKSQKISLPDGIVLLFSSLFLTHSYEAMAILGPVLVVITLLRLRDHVGDWRSRIVLVLSAMCFCLSIFIATQSIFNHRDPTAVQNASNIANFLSNIQLMLSILVLCLYIFSGWYNSKRLNAVFNFAFIGIAIPFLCTPQIWAIPQQHYFSRSLIALVLFGGSCLFYLTKRKSQKTSFSWQVPLSLFICLNSLMIFHGYHFSAFIEAFKSEISKQTGNIPFERTSLDKKQAFLYGWAWTYPVMSKVLNESPNNAVIKIPEFYRGWVPKL